MGKRWGRHSRSRPDEGETSVLTEHAHESWLRDDAPVTTINRRWRRNRPDGPHRRRATDVHSERTDTDAARDAVGEAFDPDALFREMDARPDDELVEELCDGVSGGTDPWAVLGLTSDASWGEVVARQRELAKLHHPDLVASADDHVDPADDRMAEINAAVTQLARIYKVSGDR